MLSKRIIACLDVRNGQVVKGVNFEGLRSAGDPAELARRYNPEGIDELVILDITATIEQRRALADTISRGRARALHPPCRRRRHPNGSRRRGGSRGRRRQSEPEYRGAFGSRAHHDARTPIRQPGGARRDRRQAESPAAAGSRSTRAAARAPPGATRSNGRAKPRRAARARSCSPRSIATARKSASTAR